MATQKLQVSRALRVIPSDYCNIPFPNEKWFGALDGVSVDIIEDLDAQFISNPTVQVGDIFYSEENGVGYTVSEIVSEVELRLNYDGLDTTLAGLGVYTIYSGDMNQGCVLYIGTSIDGDITTVVTAGSDTVQFVNLPKGSFVPVQVVAVTTITDTTDIVALW